MYHCTLLSDLLTDVEDPSADSAAPGMFERVMHDWTLLSDLPTDVEDPSADSAAPGMFERVMHNWTLFSDLPTDVENESTDTAALIVKRKGKGRKVHKSEFERVTRKPCNAHLQTEVEKSADTAAPTDKPKRGKKDST